MCRIFSKVVDYFKYSIGLLEFNRFSFCLSFIVVLIAVIRASSTGLFYDEAYTYLEYAKADNFFGGRQLLNNHILNTIFISMLDLVGGDKYNDFLIRLPNLIFYVFYCYCAYLFSSSLKYKYLIFSLFILNYYLFEFFYLARGYGIATACILLACYFVMEFQKKVTHTAFSFFIFFSCLAVLSNGICLYITTSLLLSCYFIDNSFAYIKENMCAIIIYCALGVAMSLFMFYITRNGYPAYWGGYEAFFLGIGNSIFLKIKFFSILFTVFVCVVVCYSFIFIRKPFFSYACVIFLIIALLAHLLTGRGLPAGRELLPFYPLVICAIAYGIQSLNINKYFSCLGITILGISFLSQLVLIGDTNIDIGRSMRDEIRTYVFSNCISINDKMDEHVYSSVIKGQASGVYYYRKFKYLTDKYHKEN